MPELAALAPRGHAAHGRQSARQRRPAAGGPAHARLSRLRRRGAAARAHVEAKRRACWATSCATSMRLNAERRNFRVVAPMSWPPIAWAPSSRSPNRVWMAERLPDRRPPGARRAGDGDPQRDDLPGLARRLSADRPPRPVHHYEAFVHIVDSMFNQHAKWLEASQRFGWRAPVASLNYLLSSHVWRQDHNGFSHQDPGFIDVAMNKKASVIRVYLPPDANTLALGDGPLPAQPRLRQRRRRGQAAGAAISGHGRRCPPLHRRHRHLGMGQHRRGRRAGRGDGLRRGHPDARRPSPPSICCSSTSPI